jgi:hypothetical protein
LTFLSKACLLLYKRYELDLLLPTSSRSTGWWIKKLRISSSTCESAGRASPLDQVFGAVQRAGRHAARQQQDQERPANLRLDTAAEIWLTVWLNVKQLRGSRAASMG